MHLPGSAEDGIKLVSFKQARRHVAGLVDGCGLHDLVRRNYQKKEESDKKSRPLNPYDRDKLAEGKTRLDDIKYIPNTTEAAVVEAFTDSAAVYYAMREEMEGYLMAKPSRRGRKALTDTEQRFLNIFSLYGGCVEALSLLERHVQADDVQEFFSVQKEYRNIWGSQNALFKLDDERDKVLEGFLDEYINRFVYQLGVVVNGGLIHKPIKKRETTPEGNLSGMTYNFFMSLLGYLIDEKEKEDYEELVEEMTFPLGLNRETINGFSYDPSGFSKDDTKIQLNIDFKDIIGNQEGVDFLRFTLQRLFLYNPAERKNPYEDIGELSKSAMLYAGPGTGKTMLIKAAIKYGYELAEKTGKHLNVVNITQDFKTEFFGQSSRRLKNLFLKGTDPNGIGLIIFEDVDGLVKNRSDGDSSSGQAEENVLNTLLNLFEGVETEYHTNWLAISTSNRSHDVDKALAGRAGITKIYCPGATTLAELKELNQRLTKKGRSNGYLDVSDKEWDEIAEVCRKNGYNGRQIRNAAVTLLTGVGNYDIGEELLAEEDTDKVHKELLKGMKSRKVTGKDLLAAVRQAADDEMREAEYDLAEKAKDRAERVLVELMGNEQGKSLYLSRLARLKNEELDALPPDVKELLAKLQLGDNMRLEEENSALRTEKHGLETENTRLQRELDKGKGK